MVNVEAIVSKLARYIGTKLWKHSFVASKAMSMIKAPAIDEPDRPVRLYYETGSKGSTTRHKESEGVDPALLVPVKEDWEHDLNVEEFAVKRKTFREKTEAWQ